MAALSAVAAAVLASCTTWRVPPPHLMGPGGPFESTALHQWWGDGVPGSPSIRINLATQKAHFLRNGRPVGWTTVATGTPDYPTHPGSFRILNKEVEQVSNTYGMIIASDGDVMIATCAGAAKRSRTARDLPGHRCRIGCKSRRMASACTPESSRARAVPHRTAASGCRGYGDQVFSKRPGGHAGDGRASPRGGRSFRHRKCRLRRESAGRTAARIILPAPWRRRPGQIVNPYTWFGEAPRIEQSRQRSRG